MIGGQKGLREGGIIMYSACRYVPHTLRRIISHKIVLGASCIKEGLRRRVYNLV